MLDPAIDAFLNERKTVWLKNRTKGDMTDAEKAELERQAREAFSMVKWLPEAARRAVQLSAVTHSGKFSHPDAKISPVIARTERKTDGFLRSGNVDVELDVYGNAAALDVYKFLNVRIADGRTILSHLEQRTAMIKQQLDIPGVSYDDLAKGLLAIKKNGAETVRTSEKIKQVYFPVGHGNYHVLSILTPSGLMFKLKERINRLRFSGDHKAAREARNAGQYYDGELSELCGLSMIGFGGTQPQNISVLNNQNGGVAFLLPSMPPGPKSCFHSHSIQPPQTDFFDTCRDSGVYSSAFEQLHQHMAGLKKADTLEQRKQRDQSIRHIICLVADRLWQIRALDGGWSRAGIYRQLPHHQKIWLDQMYVDERALKPEYLTMVKRELANWLANRYAKMSGDLASGLSDRELQRLLQRFRRQIEWCEEALR